MKKRIVLIGVLLIGVLGVAAAGGYAVHNIGGEAKAAEAAATAKAEADAKNPTSNGQLSPSSAKTGALRQLRSSDVSRSLRSRAR